MANTGFLSVSDLSFDGIKNNLKTYLRGQTVYKDYDFEGSNLNALLDILSYNTYMNSYYLNMVGSEMFLDSAQLKESVVSHAKELNYVPRSRTSAMAQVTFSVDTGTQSPAYVIIPAGFSMKTTVDNISYTFTTQNQIIINGNNGQYISDVTNIYEGLPVTEFFTAANNNHFVLSSNNVDINSLQVTVINSSTDSANAIYTEAYSLYGLNSSSEVFFVEGALQDQYAIVFGDGVSGKALSNGNIVKVNYRSCNAAAANKAYSFTATNKLNGLYPVTVSTVSVAINGSEREDIESIRFNAPRYFSTQNRAVTTQDYTNLILENFPQIQTVNVYGGEDATPPQFGRVLITAIPSGISTILSSELKNEIINFLSTKNIITIPVIVDPEYLYVSINTTVQYDPTVTTKSVQLLSTEVLNQIIQYQSDNLNNFGDDLRKSKLLHYIDASDSAIVSNQTNLKLIYKSTPTRGISNLLSFTFGNPIDRTISQAYSNDETEVVLSNFFSYVDSSGTIYNARISDDGMGNLRLYFLSPTSVKVILNSNIGTVNYSTGEMNLTLNPYDYTNSIDFYAQLLNDDIIVQQNKFLKIDYSKVAVSIVVFNH